MLLPSLAALQIGSPVDDDDDEDDVMAEELYKEMEVDNDDLFDQMKETLKKPDDEEEFVNYLLKLIEQDKFNSVPKRFWAQKKFVMAAIERNYGSFFHIDRSLAKDRELFLKAVKLNGVFLKVGNIGNFDNDFEIVLAAVKQNGLSIVFARSNMKSNFEIALAAVKENGSAFRYLVTDFANNLEIVYEAVKSYGSMLEFVAYELRNDPVVVLAAVTSYGRALEFASDVLKKNRKIVLAAVENDGWALAHANECMQNDPEIATIAINENIDTMANVDDTLTENAEFMLAALSSKNVTSYDQVLSYCQQHLLENRDFFLAAVKINGFVLELAESLNPNFEQDEEIVLAAVKQNGIAIEYASEFLRNDMTILLAAVQSNGLSLEFGPVELDDIRHIVIAALKQNGFALQYLKNEEKDREFVMTAVQENGSSLEFAGQFTNDYDVVLAAVENNPSGFRFADARFRQDGTIFLAAVMGDGDWYGRAPTRFQDLYSFQLAASTAKLNPNFRVASNLMKDIQERIMEIMPPKPKEDDAVALAKDPTKRQLQICRQIEKYEDDIGKIINSVDKSTTLSDQEKEYLSNQFNFLSKRLGNDKTNDCNRLIYMTLGDDYRRKRKK